MPRLRQLSGREVRAIHDAFELVRQKGSHMVMQRKVADTTVTAIVPDHRELRIGTLQSVIRQSKLPRELFEV